MPGAVITFANPALCTHGGKATPFPPAGFVVIGGFGAMNLSHQYFITGCGFPAVTLGAQPPCVMGRFFEGTKQVFTKGLPLALLPDSVASSKGLPNPTPLIITPRTEPLPQVFAR